MMFLRNKTVYKLIVLNYFLDSNESPEIRNATRSLQLIVDDAD